ncbi:MAG: hypothetical protein WC635_03175 [Bacteriovorax sp.]
MSKILSLCDKLREISTNAAIASGHTTNQSKVFSEIAKQIGISSQQFSSGVERILKCLGPMNKKILECIILDEQRTKMVQTIYLLKTDTNRDHLLNHVAKIEWEIFQLLNLAQEDLAKIKPEATQIRQNAHRAWSIVMALRVSAGTQEDEEASVFFSSIASALDSKVEESLQSVELMMSILKSVDESLSVRCHCMRGEVNAA